MCGLTGSIPPGSATLPGPPSFKINLRIPHHIAEFAPFPASGYPKLLTELGNRTCGHFAEPAFGSRGEWVCADAS
jgi:hypothetical protein